MNLFSSQSFMLVSITFLKSLLANKSHGLFLQPSNYEEFSSRLDDHDSSQKHGKVPLKSELEWEWMCPAKVLHEWLATEGRVTRKSVTGNCSHMYWPSGHCFQQIREENGGKDGIDETHWQEERNLTWLLKIRTGMCLIRFEYSTNGTT